jgi:hypothetical protein
MLNNRAQLTAATFGEMMLPTMEDVIAGASDFLDGFAEMDEGQRKALISIAAWIAAVGPAILLVGKLNTGIGTVSTTLGKLLLASTEAGGGATGMLSALKGLLGPAGIAAVAAAALYGAYKWYDYASGAAAAREATKGMIDTAKDWEQTQAKTIYDTGNDPFSRFGIDESAFSSGIDAAKDWLDTIRKVWSDGTKDSKAAVNEYIDQFTAGSDEVRDAIKARQATQEKYGVKGDKTATDDLKKLKAYDKEVAALLKKRRNKTLTEDEQQRLDRSFKSAWRSSCATSPARAGAMTASPKRWKRRKRALPPRGNPQEATCTETRCPRPPPGTRPKSIPSTNPIRTSTRISWRSLMRRKDRTRWIS